MTQWQPFWIASMEEEGGTIYLISSGHQIALSRPGGLQTSNKPLVYEETVIYATDDWCTSSNIPYYQE